MPAVRKVSKEQIIDAAVDVLRDDGFSAINALSLIQSPSPRDGLLSRMPSSA